MTKLKASKCERYAYILAYCNDLTRGARTSDNVSKGGKKAVFDGRLMAEIFEKFFKVFENIFELFKICGIIKTLPPESYRSQGQPGHLAFIEQR